MKLLENTNIKLNDTDIELLYLVLGEKKCNNSYTSKFIQYILLALVASILVFIFLLPSVNNYISKAIPNDMGRILFIVSIFFIIIYLVDRIINEYRNKEIICS